MHPVTVKAGACLNQPAKNFFALPTAPKPPLDRHQYGASLSGPIVRNQTFFFVDYAGLKDHAGHKVALTGDLKGDSITVSKFEMPAAKAPAKK